MFTVSKVFLINDINGYSDENQEQKNEFHKKGQAFLKKIAELLGLHSSEYQIRSNVAGIAVSGEITLHTDSLYMQINCSSMNGSMILYRSCNGMTDYCGGPNNYAFFDKLQTKEQKEAFIAKLKTFVK